MTDRIDQMVKHSETEGEDKYGIPTFFAQVDKWTRGSKRKKQLLRVWLGFLAMGVEPPLSRVEKQELDDFLKALGKRDPEGLDAVLDLANAVRGRAKGDTKLSGVQHE